MKRTLFASLLLLGLAAACGASSTGGSGATATTAASSSPAASASASGASADACSLVAKSDVEALIGAVSSTPKSTGGTLPGASTGGSVCAFNGANGIVTVGVLTKAETRSEFDTVARQVPGVQPISGLGDAAYGTSAGVGSAGGASVLVLKGTTYFSLSATSSSVSSDKLFDGLKTLAGKAVTKL